jgi:membrane-associated PAP2 superfamily phosphatase
MKRTLLIETLLTIVLAVISTLVISALNLDMRLESAFYDPIQKWKFSQIQPWIGFYHYGNLPGILFLVVSLAGILLGFWIQRITKFRKLFALYILAVVLGPGLFINAVFKDHWGRPRPRDVIEFGGQMQFREVWQPDLNTKGKSFPCGHASIGFALFVPYFWLRRKRPVLAATILAGGLAYGGLMGAARMAQGGHFLSDVVWSAAMVYLVSAAIAALLRIDENPFADETAIMMHRQK